MSTIGLRKGMAAAEPKDPAPPKLYTAPSEANSQYPGPAGFEAIDTTGWLLSGGGPVPVTGPIACTADPTAAADPARVGRVRSATAPAQAAESTRRRDTRCERRRP